jgi:two-component system, NtrC family, nitrogen regulation sensor histidine kinase NtrY
MGSENLLSTRFRYLTLTVLAAFLAGAGYCLALHRFTPAIICFSCSLITLALLDRIYRATLKSVTLFFQSLKNDDTSLRFPVVLRNTALAGLYDTMNSLTQHFRDIRLKNEYHEKYLRTLIRHSASGLIVVNGTDQIELINDEACRFAGIPPESTNLHLLRIRNPEFYQAVCGVMPGVSRTYRQIQGGQVQVLTFRASHFRRDSETLRLISIQDIRRELELKEGESYRKVISVLTHEIMNLMSPLTSVAGVLEQMYLVPHPPGVNDMDEERIRTTRNCVAVIRDQRMGIAGFLGNYRKISKIPDPEISPFDAADWLDQLRIAFSDKLEQHRIELEVVHDRAVVHIEADKKLMNQMVVNLMNNAIDAVAEYEGSRIIRIRLETANVNRIRFTVENNGPWIPAERLEKVFIPFYTTKKEGSGIGLSICREIVRAHHGSLALVSEPGGMTAFTVEL